MTEHRHPLAGPPGSGFLMIGLAIACIVFPPLIPIMLIVIWLTGRED